MAYTQRQIAGHIIELQRYLHGIACFNDQVPVIIPDGIYGKETSNAVRAFQREYNLNETGRADIGTWNKIVQIYRKTVNADAEPFISFPDNSHIIRMGDRGILVYAVQSMLCYIADYFDNTECPAVSGVYNSETAKCIRLFQQMNNLPATATVDKATWNLLVMTSRNCRY